MLFSRLDAAGFRRKMGIESMQGPTVMFQSRLIPVVAAALVILGILELLKPFGPPYLRRPGVLILLGGLLALRYVGVVVSRNRRRMLEEVPKRPLGLSDD